MEEVVNSGEELEVKFLVSNLDGIRNKTISLGGILIQPRQHEYNLLFDNPDRKLTLDRKILRLRRDINCYLTYKGPGSSINGVYARKEIEIEVSNFNQARDLLRALDFKVTFIYEKYRSLFAYKNFHIALDELPIGDFIEIEGPDGEGIKALSLGLHLEWNDRIVTNYKTLFDEVCKKLESDIGNLTFSDFEDIDVLPEMMGVCLADL